MTSCTFTLLSIYMTVCLTGLTGWGRARAAEELRATFIKPRVLQDMFQKRNGAIPPMNGAGAGLVSGANVTGVSPTTLALALAILNGTTPPAPAPVPGHEFSPVTLYSGWSRLNRLIGFTFISTMGSIGGIFFVSSFFVEKTLRKAGNVYLACTGLADLPWTLVMAPTAALAVLSAEYDTTSVCHFMQYLAEFSTYSYSLLFSLTGIESYFRLCRSSRAYHAFISMRVGVVSALVFSLSAILAYLDVYMAYDYDYCERKHPGNVSYKTAMTTMFHIFPFFVTLGGFIKGCKSMRRRARQRVQFRRSQQYSRDLSLIAANITVYLVYAIFWAPHVVVSHLYPNINNKTYYYSAWTGAVRALLPCMIYVTIDKSFRHAFSYLFHYLCCKSNVSDTIANRHRRLPQETKTPNENISVHIMRSALTAASPQRTASSSRENQCL